MSRQAEKKVRNRNAIMAAAVSVFAEKGKDNTSISDVVQASGLARGTFYNYFPSLEAVWQTILEDFFTQVADAAHRGRMAARDMEEFVRQGYASYFELLASQPEYIDLIVRNPHAVRQTFMEGPSSLSVYTQLEEDMHQSGYFTAYTDEEVRVLCVAMIGSVFEVLSQSAAPGKQPNPEMLIGTLTNLLVHGLKSRQR